EVLLYHKIQNISLGGICIQSASIEEVGTIVDLVINFPDLDAQVALKGEVVWANREPPMDMGIRYIDLDEERKETLRKYIGMVGRREARRLTGASRARAEHARAPGSCESPSRPAPPSSVDTRRSRA